MRIVQGGMRYIESNFQLQLNKRETGPYFLQNFQCTTMFICAYCRIVNWTLNVKVFLQLMSVGLAWKSAAQIFRTISGSQMSSELLQNAEIIKQADVLLWKIWRIYGLGLIWICLTLRKNFFLIAFNFCLNFQNKQLYARTYANMMKT